MTSKPPPTILPAEHPGETVEFIDLIRSAGFEIYPNGVLVVSKKRCGR